MIRTGKDDDEATFVFNKLCVCCQLLRVNSPLVALIVACEPRVTASAAVSLAALARRQIARFTGSPSHQA